MILGSLFNFSDKEDEGLYWNTDCHLERCNHTLHVFSIIFVVLSKIRRGMQWLTLAL